MVASARSLAGSRNQLRGLADRDGDASSPVSGLLVSFLAFERTLVFGFRFSTGRAGSGRRREYSPRSAAARLILGGLGLLVAGGGAAVLRKLFQAATFSYDGTQYKGAGVQGITPNDKFYCVTKNVVDPRGR